MVLTTILLFLAWCWTDEPILAVMWIITGVIAGRKIGILRRDTR